MTAPNRPHDATLKVTPSNQIPPSVLPQITEEISSVLQLTSLNANAGNPARITNLAQANITANTNRGSQNAIANQQAHAQLNLSVVGKTVNRVQNLGPLQARSSVDVITDNAAAETIADLKAVLNATATGRVVTPFNWQKLLASLKRVLAEIQHIETVNNRLQGQGTLESPFITTDGQPLYVRAEVTLGFPRYQPQQLSLEVLRRMLTATPAVVD